MLTKPPKYKPDELLNKFMEYIEDCTDKERFPNIVGFSVFAKMNRSVYYRYKEREEYKEAIELIELSLEDETIQHKVRAKNPAGAIFYAKNKLNYVDKKEIETKTTNNVVMLTSKEELISGIMQLTTRLNQKDQLNIINVESDDIREECLEECNDYEELL